jgi:ABC-type sugar transport system ATPase subunit
MENPKPLLQIEGVAKAFPGVQALKGVNLTACEGEVHALVGENGAGKSTLMKILAGVHPPDSGRILWQGEPLHLHSPAEAQRRGIRIMYQEFNLLPDLTVAENLLLNEEPRNRFGLIDWKAMNRRARELLAHLEMPLDPEAPVYTLTVAQQQVVEIVKALADEARLLIMDEPTAALNPTEVEHLFNAIRRLTARGTAVIFISHRLDEVLAISQRVTILKDGAVVTTQPTEALTKPEMVRHMVGRSLEDIFPPRCTRKSETPFMEVRGLHSPSLHDIHFQLYPGEVVGFAGLEGHGQRELARTLFGLEPTGSGEVLVEGRHIRLTDPRAAIDAGIVFISDDRKAEGLALPLAVRENISLPNLKRFSRLGAMHDKNERESVSEMVSKIGVKTPTIDQPVRLLSGGNQQKTVLAKWLIQKPRLLIFTEPTRGVDIGAKVEIYRLIHQLAGEGAAVLVVSSELLELIGLCSRILVMRDGRIQAELDGATATEESIMLAATGAHD